MRIGPCPICNTNIYKWRRPRLIQKTQYGWAINFKKQPYEYNEKGTDFWILQTDRSRMRVSICKRCLEMLTDGQVKSIFSDIIYTKLKKVEQDRRGHIREKLFERIRSIEIWRWAKTEQEIVDYLKEVEQPKVQQPKTDKATP